MPLDCCLSVGEECVSLIFANPLAIFPVLLVYRYFVDTYLAAYVVGTLVLNVKTIISEIIIRLVSEYSANSKR